MGTATELSATRPEVYAGNGQIHPVEWISSEALANGFRQYNQGLGVSVVHQETLDAILKQQSQQISPVLADHQRRVGGYAGTILPIIYPEYDDVFHIGLIRVAGAVHDVGKKEIDRDVVFRSIGVEGYGDFDRARDMPEMMRHAQLGHKILMDSHVELPPEASLIAGCHHQFPEDGQQPYGIDLSKIDNVFNHDPEMARWVRCGVGVVSLADYFDATSRSNGYFTNDDSRNKGMVAYIKKYQPDKYEQILMALMNERAHYLIKQEKLVLAA